MNKPVTSAELKPAVTTGPLPSSRKIFVTSDEAPDVHVPLRGMDAPSVPSPLAGDAVSVPSPLVGEGQGGGATRAVVRGATPLPSPQERASLVSSPQGGREQSAQAARAPIIT